MERERKQADYTQSTGFADQGTEMMAGKTGMRSHLIGQLYDFRCPYSDAIVTVQWGDMRRERWNLKLLASH